jgi:ABC-2 type transport system ATP-binding protein
MRQRLGLAAALLGDPSVLLLDEPANGLDPHGIRWLRTTLRDLAAEGRAVLVSSHQLDEVARMADDVIVIDRGRLLRQGSLEELTNRGKVVVEGRFRNDARHGAWKEWTADGVPTLEQGCAPPAPRSGCFARWAHGLALWGSLSGARARTGGGSDDPSATPG